ncbi:MAG TPA: hypothetical protein ENI65_02245 [Gammaproteobacteria bacterium]|nr:hypothetical protein [Gammaproteobacteria bacterium]
MKKYNISAVLIVLILAVVSSASAQEKKVVTKKAAEPQKEVICFESRLGASEVTQREIKPGLPNVKCSPKTGAVLWWGDPYEGTVPMGKMPIKADYSKGVAVVKPRSAKMALLPICGTACHNGTYPPLPKNKRPRKLTMHTDIVPDSLNLQHGRGAIWCLDCHNTKKRNKFVDNFGDEIDFNQPQKLCGKCHGPIYRDWRDGIHGKRIGQWATTGKKRWFVCTECHNPHDVQQGKRNSGFAQLAPEPAPILPKGMKNADHERHHNTDESGQENKGSKQKGH